MNKLASGAAAFAAGALMASTAAFAWDAPPTSDPNCPSCRFVTGAVFHHGIGHQCTWVTIASIDVNVPDDPRRFVISAADPAVFTYDRVDALLSHAFDVSRFDPKTGKWKGPVVSIEYDPGAPTTAEATHCGSPGGTTILGASSNHKDE